MIRILTGDCRAHLASIKDNSINCVVTSPPYWGLRDYGLGPNSFGLEPTYQLYVQHSVEIFREVRRILRSDGTLWLNLGDSYAAGGRGGGGSFAKERPGWNGQPMEFGKKRGIAGLKSKDLVGIPWRVAFALQEDGWYLRQDNIWSKPNPMPESVTDRTTRAHEYMFHFSKSARYYYDAEAIKEDGVMRPQNRFTSREDHPKGDEGRPAHRRPPGGTGDKQRGHSRRHAGFNDRWNAMERAEQCGSKRNKRSVWHIATKPYRDAHFATFPPALVEPCILAGCPPNGIVLDPFAGSGTVGAVAQALNRHAILIEQNPKYVEMIERRCAMELRP